MCNSQGKNKVIVVVVVVVIIFFFGKRKAKVKTIALYIFDKISQAKSFVSEISWLHNKLLAASNYCLNKKIGHLLMKLKLPLLHSL